jgi:hypothetical protein
MKKLILATLVVFAAASNADAQLLRGMGRIQGTVADESGTPLTGVVITAKLAGLAGGIDARSDDKGVWKVGGMARGDWQVDFEKAGYEQRRAKVVLPVELAKVPTVVVTMKKAS